MLALSDYFVIKTDHWVKGTNGPYYFVPLDPKYHSTKFNSGYLDERGFIHDVCGRGWFKSVEDAIPAFKIWAEHNGIKMTPDYRRQVSVKVTPFISEIIQLAAFAKNIPWYTREKTVRSVSSQILILKLKVYDGGSEWILDAIYDRASVSISNFSDWPLVSVEEFLNELNKPAAPPEPPKIMLGDSEITFSKSSSAATTKGSVLIGGQVCCTIERAKTIIEFYRTYHKNELNVIGHKPIFQSNGDIVFGCRTLTPDTIDQIEKRIAEIK